MQVFRTVLTALGPLPKGRMMNNQEQIRVMIVDDHSMVRRGLAAILKIRPGLELV